MGRPGSNGWTSEDAYEQGVAFPTGINYFRGIDDVSCSADSWDSCTYSDRDQNDCSHNEDVYLNCVAADTGTTNY